jgi:hypothetical protein
MLRISILEGRNERRLIVEGKLVAPWSAELKTACDKARVDLGGRKLVVDVRNLSVISQEGENVLLDLINQGVRFRCCGVFTKQVLKQLAGRMRGTSRRRTHAMADEE